ncbi:MAG: alpha/beta fold hydrolase [Phycisphaerales bacterium]|nr:alpha/beta fold hydrolase [Phycisphaerales bacterium]
MTDQQKKSEASARGFKPAWWLRGGHAQTLWASMMRKVRLDTRRERIESPDGDFIDLDWAGDSGPIVIVLPGLQGDLQSSHVRGLMQHCVKHRWRAVLLNYRGRGEPNRLAHSYHCGMTCDLDYLAGLLARREPDTPISVVGYSVGANICLRWLGQCGRDGKQAPVKAAVGVSVPFYLGDVARKIENGFSRIYQNHLLKSLRGDLRMKMESRDVGLDITLDQLHELTTFCEFDERVSAPMNGFADAEDYYTQTRCDAVLQHVSVPTLILNARNDPLVPADLIPHENDVSDQITMEISDHGGHLGFVSGRWPWAAKFWLDQRVLEFLAPFA